MTTMTDSITLGTHERYEHFVQRLIADKNYIVDTNVRWDIASTIYDDSTSLLHASAKYKILAKSYGTFANYFFLQSTDDRSYANLYVGNNKKVDITVYSNTQLKNDQFVHIIKKLLPEITPKNEDSTKVSFWNNTVEGPKSVTRYIQTNQWEDIKHNYGTSTRDSLNSLMEFRPKKGGQLIIWHGEPGTGKTYALRALCQSWKEWCTSEYILDPELMFTNSPSYMASMLFGSQGDLEIDEDDDDEDEKAKRKKWKLLICEDTGQLLGETAKSEAGQGLSRLLNIADGFIGQGLRVLILITTNEEYEKLHPAVVRKGRCAAVIHFAELDPQAAREWGKVNNIEVAAKAQSISDLYELLGDKQIINVAKPNKVGFGPLA